MVIQQIKIDFNVTPQIKRYVFVYLIITDTGCYLIDSGVAGSERMIEKAVIESGYHPSDIKAIFLTHAHPDHIGTASYFREKYGADEVSYRMDDVVFIGDAVPVKGDIPIFINLKDTKNSLMRLEQLSDVKSFYPAWDQTYSAEMLKEKIDDAKELVAKLEEIVGAADYSMEASELVDWVCESLDMPMLKTNPLFARTVACCRKDR